MWLTPQKIKIDAKSAENALKTKFWGWTHKNNFDKCFDFTYMPGKGVECSMSYSTILSFPKLGNIN